MWKNCIKKQQGFTMIEMLLALLATSVCTLLLTQVVSVMAHTYKKDYYAEDSIAIKQLQLLFAQGSAYEVADTSCSIRYHNKIISFEVYEDKLIRRSGFEIFLQAIDSASFHQEGGCVYVSWFRADEHTQASLGCE